MGWGSLNVVIAVITLMSPVFRQGDDVPIVGRRTCHRPAKLSNDCHAWLECCEGLVTVIADSPSRGHPLPSFRVSSHSGRWRGSVCLEWTLPLTPMEAT